MFSGFPASAQTAHPRGHHHVPTRASGWEHRSSTCHPLPRDLPQRRTHLGSALTIKKMVVARRPFLRPEMRFGSAGSPWALEGPRKAFEDLICYDRATGVMRG